jgi:hypothetical protein
MKCSFWGFDEMTSRGFLINVFLLFILIVSLEIIKEKKQRYKQQLNAEYVLFARKF